MLASSAATGHGAWELGMCSRLPPGSNIRLGEPQEPRLPANESKHRRAKFLHLIAEELLSSYRDSLLGEAIAP